VESDIDDLLRGDSADKQGFRGNLILQPLGASTPTRILSKKASRSSAYIQWCLLNLGKVMATNRKLSLDFPGDLSRLGLCPGQIHQAPECASLLNARESKKLSHGGFMQYSNTTDFQRGPRR
jgi:hypothetical protein